MLWSVLTTLLILLPHAGVVSSVTSTWINLWNLQGLREDRWVYHSLSHFPLTPGVQAFSVSGCGNVGVVHVAPELRHLNQAWGISGLTVVVIQLLLISPKWCWKLGDLNTAAKSAHLEKIHRVCLWICWSFSTIFPPTLVMIGPIVN